MLVGRALDKVVLTILTDTGRNTDSVVSEEFEVEHAEDVAHQILHQVQLIREADHL
jgi:hypothetical protein